MTEKNWCIWCGTYLGSDWPTGKDGLPDRWASLSCPNCERNTGYDSKRFIPPNVGIGVPLRCPRCQYVHNLDLVGNIYGLNPPLPCPQCGFDLRATYDPNRQPNTQPVKTSTPLSQKVDDSQRSQSDFGYIAGALRSNQLATNTLTEVDDWVPETSSPPSLAAQKKTSDPDIILGNWRGIHEGYPAADDNSIISIIKREGAYRYVGILKQVGNVLKSAKFSILEEMCWFNPTDEPGIYTGNMKRRERSTGVPQVNALTVKMLTPDRIKSTDKFGTLYSTRVTDVAPQPHPVVESKWQSQQHSTTPPVITQLPPSRPTQRPEPVYPIPDFGRSKSSSEVMIKAFGWAIGILLLTISIVLGIMLSRILFNTQLLGLLPSMNELPLYPLLFMQFSPVALFTLFTLGYVIPPIWKKLTWKYSKKDRTRWVAIPAKIILFLWILVVIALLVLVYLGYNVSELLNSGIAWISRG